MDVVVQDVLTVPLDHLLKCPPSLHRDGFLLYDESILHSEIENETN